MNSLELALWVIKNGHFVSNVEEGGNAESGPRVLGYEGFRCGSLAVLRYVDSWNGDVRVDLMCRRPIMGLRPEGIEEEGWYERAFGRTTSSYLRRVMSRNLPRR